MSEKENYHNLCIKVPKQLLKEFNTELVYKYGQTYGKMTKGVREAMKLWADTHKLEREKRKRQKH